MHHQGLEKFVKKESLFPHKYISIQNTDNVSKSIAFRQLYGEFNKLKVLSVILIFVSGLPAVK